MNQDASRFIPCVVSELGRLHAPRLEAGTVLAVGNFDGVHRGHQQLLSQVCEIARRRNLPSVVISFEPLTREFFSSQVLKLQTPQARSQLLLEAGIEHCFVLRFDRALAQLEPEVFVRDILVAWARGQAVVVGEDFRFGHLRRGDISLLRRVAAGLHLEICTAQLRGIAAGPKVGSSAVRSLLREHRYASAAEHLGRPYEICLAAVSSPHVGRPVALQSLHFDLSSLVTLGDGVCTGWVGGVGEEPLRPSLLCLSASRRSTDLAAQYLAAHLLDGDPIKAAQHYRIRFGGLLRPDRMGISVAHSQTQLAEDKRQAACWFAQYATPQDPSDRTMPGLSGPGMPGASK